MIGQNVVIIFYFLKTRKDKKLWFVRGDRTFFIEFPTPGAYLINKMNNLNSYMMTYL